MKRQLFFIHGGVTFSKHEDYIEYLRTREISLDSFESWSKGYLDKQLGGDFEIIRPRMPRSENAHYKEWVIHFERYFPFFRDGIVLMGNSLGAGFLVKWLANNTFPVDISGLFFVAPPFDNVLGDEEELTNGFVIRGNLSRVVDQCANIHFFFSEDDMCVPVAYAEKFRAKLPRAHFHIYSTKGGHFRVEQFPELIRLTQNILSEA